MQRVHFTFALVACALSQAFADLSVTINHKPEASQPAENDSHHDDKQSAHDNAALPNKARELPPQGDGDGDRYPPAADPAPADIPPAYDAPAGDGDGEYAAPSVNDVPPAGPPPPPPIVPNADDNVFATSTKAPWQKYAGPIVGGVVGAGALAGVIAVSVIKKKQAGVAGAADGVEPAIEAPTPQAAAASLPAVVPESELTSPIPTGARELNVKDVSGFPVGTKFIIDKGLPTEEVNIVTAHGSLITKTPLKFAHSAGAKITVVLPDPKLPAAAPPSMKSAALPSMRNAAAPTMLNAPASIGRVAPPSLKSMASPSVMKSAAPSMRGAPSAASAPAPALPSPAAQATNGVTHSNTKFIVFGAIGVCALCAALALCAICFLRKKGSKKGKKTRPAQETPMIPEDQMPLNGTVANLHPSDSQYQGMESQYLPVAAAPSLGIGSMPTMAAMPQTANMPTMAAVHDGIPMQTMPPPPGFPSVNPQANAAAHTASPLAATTNVLPPTAYNMGQVPPTIHHR